AARNTRRHKYPRSGGRVENDISGLSYRTGQWLLTLIESISSQPMPRSILASTLDRPEYVSRASINLKRALYRRFALRQSLRLGKATADRQAPVFQDFLRRLLLAPQSLAAPPRVFRAKRATIDW